MTAGGDQVLQVRGQWYCTVPQGSQICAWSTFVLNFDFCSSLDETFTVKLIPKLRTLPSVCSSKGSRPDLLISPHTDEHPASRCFCLSWFSLFPMDRVNGNCGFAFKTFSYWLLNSLAHSAFLVPRPKRSLEDLNHWVCRPARKQGISKVISDHLLGRSWVFHSKYLEISLKQAQILSPFEKSDFPGKMNQFWLFIALKIRVSFKM